MNFFDSLNPEQRQAVEHTSGPLLVNAGPGTGKTQTLAARIAWLIQKGVPPEAILAVTFTNKAADNMRERVCAFVETRDLASLQTHISTLHAFAYDFLLGEYGSIAVADTEAQISIIEEVLKEIGVKIATRELPNIIRTLGIVKNQLNPDSGWPKIDKIVSAKDLLERYQQKLRDRKVFDFDDLIREMYFLLKEDPKLRAREQNRFQHILVDEYQDMTPLQASLLDLLAASLRNLWAIGDPDQAIYAWRGSSVRLMIDFDKRYPDAKIVILKQNYRNPASILKPACRLIQHNQNRLPKALYPVTENGEKIRLWTMDDEVTGRWAVQQILESFFGSTTSMVAADQLDGVHAPEGAVGQPRLQEHIGIGFHDVAILFRKQKEGEILKAFLEEKGFPAHLSCEKNLYKEKPVAEFITLAHLLVTPGDDQWLYRFMLSLPGFPEVYTEEWYQKSRQTKQLLHSVIVDKSEAGEMPPAVYDFWNKIMGFLETAELKSGEPFQQFWAFLSDNFFPLLNLGSRDQKRLQSFLPTAQLFFTENSREVLKKLVAQAETQHELEPEIAPQKIQLLTLHAAKGLEFKRVIIVGLEEGNFPIQKAETLEQIEEERRLMYVGMTRAIEELHLVTVKKRRSEEVRQSQFLAEIPQEFLAHGGFSDRYARKQKAREKKMMQPSLF